MSVGPIEELTVSYDPGRVRSRMEDARRRMRSRLLTLVISVVILIIVFVWKREQMTGAAVFVIYAVVLSISVGLFLFFLLRYRSAKRELAAIGSGVAVRIGRTGAEVAGVFAPWNEVTSLRAVSGGLGRGPLLQLERRAGEPARVPFEQLDVRPATLDSTARAYSGGRHGVDLEALES